MVRLVADLLRRNSPINLFEFVINPQSFGQTIENIFYLSFSVQLARAKITIENGLPVVSFIDTLDEHEQALENKQCVLEMTMHQYEVCRLLQLPLTIPAINQGIQYYRFNYPP